jgi:hypothetical protein
MNTTSNPHILTETARMALESKLAGTLRAYDDDQHKRSLHPTKKPVYYNPFALGLYREALERAMGSLQYEGVTVEMALAENFTGHLLKTLLKTYAKMTTAWVGDDYDYREVR